MKKKLHLVIICLISNIITTNAQQQKGIVGASNWMNKWTNFKPATTDYNEATNIITGTIDIDTKLYKRNTYQLIGVVYVTKNAVLTIEPGTVIRGDDKTCGTLVITNGAKIIAEGLETDPIIFTSNKNIAERKPGDWGGIILLGKAPINKMGGVNFLDFNLDPGVNLYGGQDAEDNSGILKYVRIEYSGRKLNALKEINGLSLAGVGRKTKLEYIQISYSNDDSFEAYGGDVIMNNLISYRATDDDFDFTQGVQCTINNSIAIRHPYSSDISGSRCFEIDSYDKIENSDSTKKLTKVIANNITLVNLEENNQGLVREAAHIGENSYFTLSNSVISGFSPFVILQNKIGDGTVNLEKINLNGLIINSCQGGILSENTNFDSGIKNWYQNPSFSLEYTNKKNIELFTDINIKGNPDFRTNTNNTLVSGN
ncbi:hypothetical protein QWY99_04530 [Flavobacterium branchiarum]|uniref:T9SS C-terminal target domain-containing protein n=1 Tax=Flavobacterium branchiarum TaxID=1114870 RepID=A0ABV5FKD0_9FLAO|nr:hypothetical protein [Flavobacterium branchiarum]MDN3672324.1 hypothetical protein [Flavobacterium branchiarum]